jgi:hypothetical protein
MSVTVTVPDDPISHQLTELIRKGATPEDAATAVLEPYQPTPLAGEAWRVVRDAALKISRLAARAAEDRAFQPAGERTAREARLAIPRVRFRVGDGTEVEWGRATVTQHQARIAWQRTQMDAIAVDIDRHTGAVDLIEQHGVSCLDDIPNWPDLLPGVLDGASGSVAA